MNKFLFSRYACGIKWIHACKSHYPAFELKVISRHTFNQLLMRLNLIIFFIAISFLKTTASVGQNISLSVKDAPLEQVLKAIKKQSGYGFWYEEKEIRKAAKVTLDIRNADLEEVLEKCFAGQPLTYSIVEQTIFVKPKESNLVERVIDFFQKIEVHGRIIDEKGEPLAGAYVTIKGTNHRTITKSDGSFILPDVDEKALLLISYLGYKSKEITAKTDLGNITLVLVAANLKEFAIVSTGYQDIPKERATGSFVLIDSALISRKVGSNILDRLDGVTSGLIFNKNKIANTPDISIRGRSTIQANPDPLIILDNFPYDGDLANINPQDVSNIIVLKDAAASSIWGTRAGNGVIVITTKKGKFNQRPQVSFNSNVTIGVKPNLYYLPQLSNQEYIEVEQFLFDKGRYNSTINNKYGALSPAVEIMLMRRNNQITDAQKSSMLDSIGRHDSRTDLDQYFYRNSVSQQHQLSINGGGQYNKYYVSTGFDKTLFNSVGQGNDRLTLNANNTSYLLNSKLELQTGVIFTIAKNENNSYSYTPKYPYERIANDNGNALAVTDGTLRLTYVDTVGAGRLLDWHYRPLDELRNQTYTSQNKLADYRFNSGLVWHLIKGIDLSGYYTFQKGTTDITINANSDSYYTRNLINNFSQINQAMGVVNRPIPLGDIVTNSNSSYYSHYGRGQISFDRNFREKHQFNAIAGYEIKDYRFDNATTMLYGYNPATATNLNSTINYTANNKYYYRSTTAKIPTGNRNSWAVDRYRSYYANVSYAYDFRYVLNASIRKDESNLFGVNSNQKGVPLWSAGFAWNISNEKFYAMPLLPYLKFRFTYGYNGNVDKSTSAYLTATTNSTPNLWDSSYLLIQNPPNPSLQWERIENINWGLDFASKNSTISGSLEFWLKNGKDLIGKSPIASQSGVDIFTGNTADTRAKGIDLQLNIKNVSHPIFTWSTAYLFNYSSDKITKYKAKAVSNNSIVSSNYTSPLENYSYYSIFAFKYRGLDTLGNPIGVLNNESSQDYAAILSSLNPEDLVYKGTLTPKIFGSIRNTFTYKNIELSFNVIYKFNYYFRRSSLTSAAVYNLLPSYQVADYDKRWQKAGDEMVTNVPALLYPLNNSRDIVYTSSEVLVEKADHIRLQDLRLGYTLNRNKIPKLPFSSIVFYGYASNVGILWKATKYKIDPDYPNAISAGRTYSLGVKADF